MLLDKISKGLYITLLVTSVVARLVIVTDNAIRLYRERHNSPSASGRKKQAARGGHSKAGSTRGTTSSKKSTNTKTTSASTRRVPTVGSPSKKSVPIASNRSGTSISSKKKKK